MDDLLNEDEFLPKPYNYTRRFSLYCAAAFCLNVVSILTARLFDPEEIILIFFFTGIIFVLPVALYCAMIFAKKKVSTLQISTITWGIAALFSSCFGGLCLTILIINGKETLNFTMYTWEPIIMVFFIYVITFGITASLIRYRVKWKKKYKNGRATGLPQ